MTSSVLRTHLSLFRGYNSAAGRKDFISTLVRNRSMARNLLAALRDDEIRGLVNEALQYEEHITTYDLIRAIPPRRCLALYRQLATIEERAQFAMPFTAQQMDSVIPYLEITESNALVEFALKQTHGWQNQTFSDLVKLRLTNSQRAAGFNHLSDPNDKVLLFHYFSGPNKRAFLDALSGPQLEALIELLRRHSTLGITPVYSLLTTANFLAIYNSIGADRDRVEFVISLPVEKRKLLLAALPDPAITNLLNSCPFGRGKHDAVIIIQEGLGPNRRLSLYRQLSDPREQVRFVERLNTAQITALKSSLIPAENAALIAAYEQVTSNIPNLVSQFRGLPDDENKVAFYLTLIPLFETYPLRMALVKKERQSFQAVLAARGIIY